MRRGATHGAHPTRRWLFDVGLFFHFVPHPSFPWTVATAIARWLWAARTRNKQADYLLEQTFGYALAADEDGKMRAVKPAAGPGAQKVWRPNDFPYLLQPGIEHHIIWCEAGSITDQEVQEVLVSAI